MVRRIERPHQHQRDQGLGSTPARRAVDQEQPEKTGRSGAMKRSLVSAMRSSPRVRIKCGGSGAAAR